jgi:arginine:ornithine antiporter/lysine permease
VGTALYIWARRESKLPVFTKAEMVVVGVLAVTSAVAIALVATGNLAVL